MQSEEQKAGIMQDQFNGRFFVLGVAACLALSLTACSKDEESKGTSSRLNPVVTKVNKDNYLSGKTFCQTYGKITGLEHGKYVKVPVDYTDPSKGSLEIYVYTLRPFDAKKPSYIYVDGGPGQNTHGAMPEFLNGQYNELRFDQRGLGCSAPETYEKYKDVSMYSSTNNVQDMDMIRKAYGISEWTVYGVSYGTVPATMYGSKYPETTKSVVLEGVFGDPLKVHRMDYKAEKLNLAIADFNRLQRESFRKLIYEGSEGSNALLKFAFGMFYSDVGLRTLKNVLMRTIDTTGTVNREILARIASFYKKQSEAYPFPQQPGAVDENMLNVIFCRDLGARHKPELGLEYSAAAGFYTTPIDGSTKNDEDCDDAGVPERAETPYLIAANPVSDPVYYFQGSHDGATHAIGAIQHWRTVPQAKSYFMMAQKGGHNPNLTRLSLSADEDATEAEKAAVRAEVEAETNLFLLAISGQEVTSAAIDAVNQNVDRAQPWKLYTDPKSLNTGIENDLEGITRSAQSKVTSF